MLTPFRGYLPAPPGPASVVDAASFARGIRDEAARYQSDHVLELAVTEGRLVRAETAVHYRYTISDDEGIVMSGIVGAAPVADLLPHEGTVPTPPHPAPIIEIRPVLAITDDALPPSTELGRGVCVLDGEGMEHVVAPVSLEGDMPAGPYVLADGHHRRRAAIQTRGRECSVLALVARAGGERLTTGTFHRRFTTAGPLPAGAGDRFDIEPMYGPRPVPGALVWVDGASGRAFKLTPRQDALDSMAPAHRDSAAAIAAALLYPLVGVTDDDAVHARTPEIALVDLMPGERTLLLPPIDIIAVLAAGRAGTPLPPKSSRFRPKPLRGLVLRSAP